MESLFEFVDHLLHHWTAAQALAVFGRLRAFGTDVDVTQAQIAAEWEPEPITRQSVNRHLKRAHWPRLKRTLHRCEEVLEEFPT
jgi:hypothetical protein